MHTRTDVQSQLLEVNLTVLDDLVLHYLRAEELIEDASGANDSVQDARYAAVAARKRLQEGNVQEVLAIVSQFCPAVLQDQHLVFKLKCQKFIEFLRHANKDGDTAALACARDELAPLALDAYPEAYLDFKKAMLLLVYPQVCPQQQQAQQPQALQQQPAYTAHSMFPGAQEILQQQWDAYGAVVDTTTTRQQAAEEDHQAQWSLAARQHVAEVLYHTALQKLGWQSPQLSLLLVYLVHLFTLYTTGSHGSDSSNSQAQQLLQASGAELVQGILLNGRDEAPFPPDTPARMYAERDVRDLMAAVSISRAAAMDALKSANGDVPAALARQLMRFRINTGELDLLVWEYAAARSLIQQPDGPLVQAAAMEWDAVPPAAAGLTAHAQSGSPCQQSMPGKAAKRNQGACSNAGSAIAAAACADIESRRIVNDPSVRDARLERSNSQSPPYKLPRWCGHAAPAQFGGSSTAAAAAVQAQQAAAGLVQWPAAVGAGCTEPGMQAATASHQQEAAHVRQLHSAVGAEIFLPEQLVQDTRQQQQQQRWQQLQRQQKSMAAASYAMAKQMQARQALGQLQSLVQQNQFNQLEQLVEELQPGLLQEDHTLRFNLKKCHFMQLIASEQLPAALQLARSQLTPLADQYPELLPALKASMAMLLPAHPMGPSSAAAAAAATEPKGSARTDVKTDKAVLLSQLLGLLQAKLGVEPPRLVKLLRVLLTGHRGWFRVQRCQDPFAGALKLDILVQADGSSAASAAATLSERVNSAGRAERAGNAGARGTRDNAARAGVGGPRHGMAVGMVPLEMLEDAEMLDVDDAGFEFDDTAVLQVMEVLELPRATALQLLAEHGGDAQAVIMQAFGA